MNSTENTGDLQPEEDRFSTDAAASAAGESRFSTKSAAVLAVLALLCVAASWGLGELTYTRFPWNSASILHRHREEIVRQPLELRPGYLNDKVILTRKIADSKNTAIVYGALGGCLGLALGVLATYLRAQPRHAKATAAARFLLSVAAGAAPSFALVPYYFDNFNPRSTIALPFLVHFGLWAGIGAAAGLALSIGMSRWRDLGRGFLGGVGGVFVGTLLYHLINPVLYPLDFDLPVPRREISRLVAALCVSLGAAIGSCAYLSSDGPVGHTSEVSIA